MIKAGDVFAIKTANGDAYFQFVKKIAPMGSLIRVLPGTFLDQPLEWGTLIDCETNFWIFFPVAAALKQGIVRKVVHCPIPEHACNPPVFRAGVVDPSTGKVETWWLWDGEKEWKIGAITEEQRRLPIRGSWNDTLLIKRIEEGWLPEKDPR
ncbi:hypothetical protein [Bordetella sp. FB-8]|uniref:hypothetical protein n=1 Tax=Bordetella sp. FB-8 TaxID=1159870 RepID=UPI00037DDFE1|nr:hypothetical protein [Bordetella sp. FB-8]